MELPAGLELGAVCASEAAGVYAYAESAINGSIHICRTDDSEPLVTLAFGAAPCRPIG